MQMQIVVQVSLPGGFFSVKICCNLKTQGLLPDLSTKYWRRDAYTHTQPVKRNFLLQLAQTQTEKQFAQRYTGVQMWYFCFCVCVYVCVHGLSLCCTFLYKFYCLLAYILYDSLCAVQKYQHLQTYKHFRIRCLTLQLHMYSCKSVIFSVIKRSSI